MESIEFRRSLTASLAIEWTEILYLISSTVFTHAYNKISWRFHLSNTCTVKSLYALLSCTGVRNTMHEIWWNNSSQN